MERQTRDEMINQTYYCYVFLLDRVDLRTYRVKSAVLLEALLQERGLLLGEAQLLARRPAVVLAPWPDRRSRAVVELSRVKVPVKQLKTEALQIYNSPASSDGLRTIRVAAGTLL